MVEKEKTIRYLINHDEGLMGLILGYGRESALAFKKKNEHIAKNTVPKWKKNYRRVAALKSKKCNIFPVEFIGNPKSEEVKAILLLYTQELEGIWEMFKSSHDLLSIILEKLCAE